MQEHECKREEQERWRPGATAHPATHQYDGGHHGRPYHGSRSKRKNGIEPHEDKRREHATTTKAASPRSSRKRIVEGKIKPGGRENVRSASFGKSPLATRKKDQNSHRRVALQETTRAALE